MPDKKPKIDLVKIGLDGMDIQSAINESTNIPNIDFSGIKVKVIKPKDPLEDKVSLVADRLIELNPNNGYMTRDEIIRFAEIPEESMSKMIRKLQSYLRRDDHWALQKTKKNGIIQYYVIKFS